MARGPKQNAGADSISAHKPADDGRAHIECAPAEAFERSAATRSTTFIIFYLLFII